VDAKKVNGRKTRFRELIREDLRRGDFGRTISRDYGELQEVFLDEERRDRLAGMNRLRRFFHAAWWLFAAMLRKLTPARRLLLLIAILFAIVPQRVETSGHDVQFSFESGLLSILLLLFVLTLELKDKLLARDELEAGRKVQIALTPEQSPSIEGWSVWLFTRTANEVGGDLVDLQKLESGNYRISIADVAGKGLRAALIATKLQATIRACSDSFTLLGGLGDRLNRVFYRDSLRNFFASLVCVEVTPGQGTLKYVNAGHLPPLVIRGEGIEETPKGGPALGIVADIECTGRTVALGGGEMFIAYSDGLTEAKNIRGDFFGQQRLSDFLLRLGDLDARAVGTALVAEVDRFAGEAQAYDDLSLVILKRNSAHGV
jgi:hypothetical protein